MQMFRVSLSFRVIHSFSVRFFSVLVRLLLLVNGTLSFSHSRNCSFVCFLSFRTFLPQFFYALCRFAINRMSFSLSVVYLFVCHSSTFFLCSFVILQWIEYHSVCQWPFCLFAITYSFLPSLQSYSKQSDIQSVSGPFYVFAFNYGFFSPQLSYVLCRVVVKRLTFSLSVNLFICLPSIMAFIHGFSMHFAESE